MGISMRSITAAWVDLWCLTRPEGASSSHGMGHEMEQARSRLPGRHHGSTEVGMIKLKPEVFAALNTQDGLLSGLQQAIQLEHGTIPTYLYALYSIKPDSNTEIQERIRSIVIQEMLHMGLACNILNALGGSPVIDRPEFVQ